MVEKHKSAIVGCGAISQAHLRVLRKLDSVEVVAVCDSDENRARATAEKWKVSHYYCDFLKMLDSESISILSILTPPSSHASLAIEAIGRGINVVIEKPLTMISKEAEAIISALNKSGAKMTVVYHWLHSKAMTKSLSLISGQKIGEIFNVNINILENPQEDPMTRDSDHWSHKISGGRYCEMLPHPVYTLQSFLGDDLQTQNVVVSKKGDLPWMPFDELHAILSAGKRHGSIYASFNSPRESVTVDVCGTKAILKIDLTNQTVLQLGPRSMEKVSVGKDTLSQASKLTLSTLKNAFDYLFHEPGDITSVYTTFIESIQNENRQPSVTPQMAYNTVRIVEEICTKIIAERDRERVN